MKAFSLRAPSAAEVDDALTPFEIELTAAFRAIEARSQRELRKALKEGLTLEQAAQRAAAVLEQEV